MGMRRRTRRRAVIATAAVVHHEDKKHAEASQAAVDDQGQEAAPPPPEPTQYAPPPADPAEQIDHLAQLHASGAITDEEFAAAKAKVLGTVHRTGRLHDESRKDVLLKALEAEVGGRVGRSRHSVHRRCRRLVAVSRPCLG